MIMLKNSNINQIVVDGFFDPSYNCCGYVGGYGKTIRITFDDNSVVKVFIKDKTSDKNAVSLGHFYDNAWECNW